MSLRINNNPQSLNSHRALQLANHQVSKSLEKLSSGMKINRAGDGPATLVISEQMRAQIAGIEQAIENSETAVSLVQTAESALDEVNKQLVNIRQLSIHAANEGANDQNMLEADQAEIFNSIQSINRIASYTQFGTKPLLDGSQGANGIANGKNLEFISANSSTKQSPVSGYDVVITETATRSSLLSGSLTQEMINAGETFTIMEGGKSFRYEMQAGMSIDSIVQHLEIELKHFNLDVQVEKVGKDQLLFTHKNYGSDYEFIVASETAGFLSDVSNVSKVSNAGLDIQGSINDELTIGKGQTLTGAVGTNVEGLKIRYTGDEIFEEAQFVGTITLAQNSLGFQVGANEGQTVKVSLKGTAANVLGKGVENISEFKSLEEIDVRTFQGAQDSLAIIDNSIDEITTTRANLGAFQKNTLESNLVNLRVANENLVSSESVIRDTDIAEEMAHFTRNKIIEQASSAMLAHANQNAQTVLNLILE